MSMKTLLEESSKLSNNNISDSRIALPLRTRKNKQKGGFRTEVRSLRCLKQKWRGRFREASHRKCSATISDRLIYAYLSVIFIKFY